MSQHWLGCYGLLLPPSFPFLIGVATHPEAEAAQMQVGVGLTGGWRAPAQSCTSFSLGNDIKEHDNNFNAWEAYTSSGISAKQRCCARHLTAHVYMPSVGGW